MKVIVELEITPPMRLYGECDADVVARMLIHLGENLRLGNPAKGSYPVNSNGIPAGTITFK